MCSAMRKKDILPFSTAWMDLKGVVLSEISQTEKGRYYMVSLTCVIQQNKSDS